MTGVEGVERRAGGGRGRLAQRGDLGEARVDGDAVVVERRRLQDDGRRAQTHGRREDPQKQPVQHRGHVLPVLANLPSSAQHTQLSSAQLSIA